MTTMKIISTPYRLCFSCHPPRIGTYSRTASGTAIPTSRYRALLPIVKVIVLVRDEVVKIDGTHRHGHIKY